MSQWYRVTDPQSPLFGCDVKLRGEYVVNVPGAESESYGHVVGLRRMDIVLGDRPFQMSADNLGLLIGMWQLDMSPVQQDVVEMSRENPYGNFIQEEKLGEAICLSLVLYDRALQVALVEKDRVLARNTWLGDLTELAEMYERIKSMYTGSSFSELVDFINVGGNDGQA